MKYRKKPVVIEAVKYDGFSNYADVLEWVKSNGKNAAYFYSPTETLFIVTLEGEMAASKGDFIIRGVQGECYPCKPDIFDATYEPE